MINVTDSNHFKNGKWKPTSAFRSNDLHKVVDTDIVPSLLPYICPGETIGREKSEPQEMKDLKWA